MRKAKPSNPGIYQGINAKVPFLAPDVITKVIPSPVDGWDAISPLAEMDPKRAPILQNWVPRPGYVELRGGYIPWAYVTDAPVETLMVYRSPIGEQLFAAAGANIYDVSVTAGIYLPDVSGLASVQFQYVNFTDQAGVAVIQCCNGINELLQYDGANWTNPAVTGLPGNTTANIVNIVLMQSRLWYVLRDTASLAYMPVGAIQGPVEGILNFGPFWRRGGYLVTATSWTIDGGQGPQAYSAFISSRGEITLFSGTDPGNPNSWSLVGTFMVAPPIGYRCAEQIGSDVGIITLQGVLPISQVLPFDPSADRSVAITARIQNAMAQAASAGQGQFGWQLITYPAQQLVILNVPISAGISQNQFVMNALTGAWCRFTGWNANCFEIFNDNLYWGGNSGFINQGYVGASDLLSPIAADMQCAFNWLDEPGRVKRMTMLQPLLNFGSSVITPSIAVDTDFQTSTAVAPIAVLTGGSLWDTAIWDVSDWSVDQISYINWLTTDAIGHAMAVRLRANIIGTGTGATGNALFDFALFDSALFDSGFSTALPILQVNAFNSIAELGGAI